MPLNLKDIGKKFLIYTSPVAPIAAIKSAINLNKSKKELDAIKAQQEADATSQYNPSQGGGGTPPPADASWGIGTKIAAGTGIAVGTGLIVWGIVAVVRKLRNKGK